MITTIWNQLKVWRRVRIGSVALFFNFRRAARITKGSAGRVRMLEDRPSHTTGGESACTSCGPAIPFEVHSSRPGTAVIVGVGLGFGYALARKLAASGFDLALVSRDANRLMPLCAELRAYGGEAESYGGDATHETDVRSLFEQIVARHGPPSLVVYSLQDFGPGNTLDISVPAFESAWRHNCLGAFLVSQVAGRMMKALGTGSIFLIGSTSAVLGRAGHLNLAVGKFGQRALAQVLARELWPFGVHVAHVLIDADIDETDSLSDETPQSDPSDIAMSILALHSQPRSAWSSEIDLRPWNEAFWEHC